jgi:hypothetical protein
MNLKTALRAAVAAAALLLLPACGGDAVPTQAANSRADSSPTPQSDGIGVSAPTVRYVAIDLNAGVYAWAIGYGIGDAETVGKGSKIDDGFDHALLWTGSSRTAVDLHPQGFLMSSAFATSGGVQVGSGSPVSGGLHALKWMGSASSVVDLAPNGAISAASGISGDQIVGCGQMGGFDFHALLWTSQGVIDLHPDGFSLSTALSTDGVHQVGRGDTISGAQHALLWSGTAQSAVDLHPAGYENSVANGVSGGQQVGVGSVGGRGHALLWTGSAASVVDLHPRGFDSTSALAVAGGLQVGTGLVSGRNRALLWSGSADSVVDLHALLPPGFSGSLAHGIDASGNIIGTADNHAILWVRQ